ncbi:MAG: hypothetical protein AB7F35_20770 [Acetobacteraceae bacterium]
MFSNNVTLVYPTLPARYDLGFARIVGHGLGNCLYTYFHAVILAKEIHAQLLAPTWPSLRIGPLLRWERSFRRYSKMFRAHPDEISGLAKTKHLLLGWPRRHRVPVGPGYRGTLRPNQMNVVITKDWTFSGLHEHRETIRRRLLEMLATPPATPPNWGARNYVAVHIRLGDFAVARPEDLTSGRVHNLRIPLEWYEQVIRRVRAVFPELPVRIFSDGKDNELRDVLRIQGTTLWREPDDVGDLLAMAQAKLLIGSNSTFVRWSAFLGNMPSVWFRTERLPEKYSDDAVPTLHVLQDVETITREALSL